MKIYKALTYLTYSLLIICCLFLILSRFSISGVRLFSVQSGSMEPKIKTGSMVIVKSRSDYVVGDIITYRDRNDSKKTITHRIVEKKSDNGIMQIVTRGDANGSSDSVYVMKDQVVGKVYFSIRYLGYLIGIAKTTVGFMILIIIPTTIIIYEEIKKIHHESKQIIQRRKKRKEEEKSKKDGLAKINNQKEDKK